MDHEVPVDARPTASLATPYAVLAHRNTSTARRVVRLIPLVVGLLLVAILVFGVVLPIADVWRALSARRMLVGP